MLWSAAGTALIEKFKQPGAFLLRESHSQLLLINGIAAVFAVGVDALYPFDGFFGGEIEGHYILVDAEYRHKAPIGILHPKGQHRVDLPAPPQGEEGGGPNQAAADLFFVQGNALGHEIQLRLA